MILPGKHLSSDRALLGVGADILAQMDRPREVTELWDRVRTARADRHASGPLSFDWFVLGLTFLYAIHAVDEDENGVRACRTSS